MERSAAGGWSFYVSPRGDDRWSGRQAEPAPGGADGPFVTIGRARDAVHRLKEDTGLVDSAVVLVRGGRYPLSAPLVFSPDDSGSVTCAAYPGESPIIDGGFPEVGTPYGGLARGLTVHAPGGIAFVAGTAVGTQGDPLSA